MTAWCAMTVRDGAGRGPARASGTMDGRGGEYSSSDGVVSTVARDRSAALDRPGNARHRRLSGRCRQRKRPPESHRAFRRLYLVSVSPLVWAVTLVVLTAILAVDLLVVARNPREPALRESALWVTGYILLAGVFGVLMSIGYGPGGGGPGFGGWLTGCSL